MYKNNRWYACCILFIYTVLSFAQSKPSSTFNNYKDTDPKAKALLKQVKDELRIDKGVELSFEFKYSPAESKPSNQKGNVFIENKKFKLELNDQEMTSDGTSLWTFIKKRNEIQIQDAAEILNDPLSPYKLLQIHDSPDFVYSLAGNTKVNNQIRDIIEFKPLDTKADFFKIRAEIDRVKKQYKKITLFLKNGDQYELNLLSQIKKSMASSFFVVDTKKYEGAKVEDLR